MSRPPLDAGQLVPRCGIRISAFGRVVGLSLMSLLLQAPNVMGQETGTDPAPAAAQPPPNPLRGDDGWVDLSGFLDKKYGFLPIGTLITEPSVGLGLAGGLAFIDAPFSRGRPDISFVGAMGTENGSKGAFAGDMRHWLDRRLETRAAILFASVNLDFYGVGDDPVLADNPLRYNLEPVGGLVEARYRLGSSSFWAGVGYAYAQTLVTFDAPPSTPGLPDVSRTSKVGGLVPSLTLDTRDNFFTPTRGSYLETTVGIFGQALGGDQDFQRLSVLAMGYTPLGRALFLGVRGQAAASSGDTPFYLRPYIYQRGVPAMRYLGEEMAQGEAELRWQFWGRFSAVGFGGAGAAWVDVEGIESPKTVAAGGAGFRYELARKYGIHMGVDVAFGPNGPAYYIQWGSAWVRP
ncbi:MAG TPA: BamA/TamA family outer membrane protein [Vicinamibacterales bacterium]